MVKRHGGERGGIEEWGRHGGGRKLFEFSG